MLSQNSKSKFLKIACPRCRTRHVVFGKATIRVKCKKCNKLLIQPRGGKARVKAPVKKII